MDIFMNYSDSRIKIANRPFKNTKLLFRAANKYVITLVNMLIMS